MTSAGNASHDLPLTLQDAVSQSRAQFGLAVGALRPRLHRFCARMCGSTLDGEDVVQEALAGDAPIDEALLALVGELPPKERAAVLLKDVLDYPLAQVADIADSTLGGAKAALHRGRAKLRSLEVVPA